MLRKLFDKAETGKLIVSGIMLCVEPTGIAATMLAMDAAIETRNKIFKDNSELAALALELDREFTTKLQAMTKPADVQQVLPDMLKAALADPTAFVRHDLDAEAILAALVQRFRADKANPDHTREDMIGAFEALFGPLLHTACNDKRLKDALDPALYRDQRKEQREMARDIKDIKNAFDSGNTNDVAAVQRARDSEYAFLHAQIAASPESPADIAELLRKMGAAGISIDELLSLIPKAEVGR